MYKRRQQASVKSFMNVKKVCSTKFRRSVLPKDKKKLQVNYFNKNKLMIIYTKIEKGNKKKKESTGIHESGLRQQVSCLL